MLFMLWRSISTTLLILILSCSAWSATPEARTAFKQGYQLLETEKYYPAINSFKLSLTDHTYPILDYSYFYIAQAYHKAGRPQEAKQVYDIVLNYYKDSILVPQTLINLTQVELQLNNLVRADETLRSLIAGHPNNELIPEARYLLGQVLEKQGKLIDAARVYRNIDLLHPKSDFAEKAFDRLEYLAKQTSLAGYEAPAATIYNLGIKYFGRRNYSKAKEYFNRLARYYKKSSFYDESLMMLGRVYLRRGQLRTAVKYFKKAINQDQDAKPESMFYLALTFGYQNKPQAAISLLEKLIQMYPNSPLADNALFYIGRYAKDQKDQPKALAAYEKIVNEYPTSDLFADAIWFIGNIYYKQNNYEAAYKVFSKAMELPADLVSDRLLFWAGKASAKIDRPDKAIAAYKTTIQRFDHSYYGYRAREELKNFGINIPADAVPEVSDQIKTINGSSILTSKHELKYKELLACGLADQAAAEAAFLVEKVPLKKKGEANLAKYHAYVMKGKYARPIHFADKKLNEAMLSGSLAKADPRLWRFSYPRGYWRYVEKYAKQYDLDPHLVYAVIREESRFKSRALSRSWAHGLMQIIPSTGRRISSAIGLRYSRWKMYEPRVNIQMGTYYLASLIKRFNGNVSLALAGYNGGPVRVKRWLKNYPDFDLDEFVEDIPLRETRNYVKKVMKSYYGYKRTYSGG